MTNKNIAEAVRFISVAIVFAVASFFAIVLWTSDFFDEFDPLIVTVDYDCREVAADSEGFPQQVIEECKKLLPPVKAKPTRSTITI